MSDVAILKTTEHQIQQNTAEIFNLCGGVEKYIVRGDRVLLKPNFIAPKKSATGATTDPAVIEAVIKLVLDCGAVPVIGEGVPLSFDADQTFRRLGMDQLAAKYGIELLNLDSYPSHTVSIPNAIVLDQILISNIVREVDKIINLPVMKTHTQTTITLGMKNLKGFIPGKEKLHLHHLGISEGVVDLNTILKPTFTLIDGIVCMEGNGPTNGSPKQMDLLLGSDDILALEIVGAEVMGFNPHSIKHITLAKNRGIGQYDQRSIRVLGEDVDAVKSDFSLPLLKINRWFGPFFLGHFLPFLSRCGIDITRATRKLQERFMPYPVFEHRCNACARCIENCPQQALAFDGGKIPILDRRKCIKCYVCDEVCVFGNVRIKGRQR